MAPADKAARKLTYPRDVQLMRAAVNAPTTTPLIILRRTQALKRASWGKKPDKARPLAAAGKRQAKTFDSNLAGLRDRTALLVRCHTMH